MTQHKPPEASVPALEDATPYVVFLQSAEYQAPSEAHPDWPAQVKFVWQLSDDENDTLWDWAGISFGKSRTTGDVSRLTKIFNALAGKPTQTQIALFDDEAWVVEYPDGSRYEVKSGDRVTIVGHLQTKDDVTKFKVDQYAAAKQPTRRPTPAPTYAGTDQPITAEVPF